MSIYKRRRLVNHVMIGFCIAGMILGLFWLSWILITLVVKALPALSLTLFTEITPGPDETGGLSNAIMGSLIISGGATLIGIPIGILSGTYLAEYGQRGWLAPTTRFLIDVLLSAPSIVIGLFIYMIVVVPMESYSAWGGSIALAIIMIPVIARTTDNMLCLVPNSLREAVVALGCPKWKMILMIIYPSARSGIMTGIVLAIARILGETAPLLFTALSNQFMSFDFSKPMANLPVVIYRFASSPYEQWNALAWAGAGLITLFVLTLNIFAKTFFKDKRTS